jgi:hypothetical protein
VGILDKFERKLEGAVSGAFAKAFRSSVEPVEIASHLERELDAHAAIVSRGRTVAPNAFHVELSPNDYQRLATMGVSLAAEFAGVIEQHAQQQRYAFTGPVHVELERHDDLDTGLFRIRAEVAATVSTPAGPEPTRAAVEQAAAFLDVRGHRQPIVAPGILIGRSPECDLRIDDPGVSRRHAELRVTYSHEGMHIEVVDLGSTNGTRVNGQRVDSAYLVDGSTITIGNTTMTVVTGRR